MASFKELSLSRPLPNTTPRQHNHSISLGVVNANHRITRRKSVTTAAANVAAAVAASMKDGSEAASLPVGAAHRRSLGARKGLESSSISGSSGSPSYLSRSINSPSQEPPVARKATPSNSDEDSKSTAKGRNRRASEGAHMKTDGKRAPADLRCDRCGKGYKHGSCLSKHMWEHDPAWSITSKLLISKHQQVQLLEAATVLVNMNVDEETHEETHDQSPDAESEFSSASPGASSEVRDGVSSAETTPPPMDEQEEDDDFEMSGVPAHWTKRPSISHAFSRSYQSIPSSSFNGSAPLHSPAFSHFRKSSIDTRPSTADTRLHEDDEADLAAAIGLCNFGTPRTGPVSMASDVPPVPPLPARYLDSGSHSGPLSPGLKHSSPGPMNEVYRRNSNAEAFFSASLNPSLSYKVSDERGARNSSSGELTAQESRHRRNADVDFGSRRGPTDDDDDGVFGRMEE
ncbi:Zinc finger C2H2 type domain-containing protein [Penicillium ucsense]|uniref:Zinc finger C2H2 type domain-containing protein n=1 Tax=Penicillium ucsense TaxID=2839758 RepID=A0A8J8W5K6_9EURO|nr:Zinc finger C2H2 type domain-containing protein [Penicillium ucsense]KAF7735979.1 Zinc finger C2H2 type domain-containing protein [Penicillium ucsense]